MCSFFGYVTDEKEAEILINAVNQNYVKPQTSRLTLKQQSQIQSGFVYIYKPNEVKITRWTDGKNWSYSKEFKNFLFYWELNTFPLLETNSNTLSVRRGNLNYTFKEQGLIKSTIKIFCKGIEYKIISYFKKEDICNGKLFPPSYYF